MHPRAQLIYGATGVIRVRTESAYWTLSPNEALLISARVVHELDMVGDVTLHSIYLPVPAPFEMGVACHLLPTNSLLREVICTLTADPSVYLPASRTAILAQLVVKLISDAVDSQIDVPQFRHNFALPLPLHTQLRKVCEALIAQPANSDTLDLWAERTAVSSRTLSRLFQSETGMSFAKWREQLRIGEAVCRLARNEPIPEVAIGLGYGDANAFTAMFKRVMDITPQRYQNQVRAPQC